MNQLFEDSSILIKDFVVPSRIPREILGKLLPILITEH